MLFFFLEINCYRVCFVVFLVGDASRVDEDWEGGIDYFNGVRCMHREPSYFLEPLDNTYLNMCEQHLADLAKFVYRN